MVWLPVAHCELNPIEMAWKQLKDFVKERNEVHFKNAYNSLMYKTQVHFVRSGEAGEGGLSACDS